MFLYTCTDDPAAAAANGLEDATLYATLEIAQTRCPGSAILVVDTAKLPDAARTAKGAPIPATALVNAEPYLPPKQITACGGYVVRKWGGDIELLLIKRRGLWDIPKGKLDAGESLPECAAREVREEVGLEEVHLHQPLGITLHGYRHKGSYAVKTTHWYLMTTTQTAFTPQASEDITKVRYRTWSKAEKKVGYETLREHMREVEPAVREALRRLRDAAAA